MLENVKLMTVSSDSFQCKSETFKIKVIKAKLHSLFKNNYIVLDVAKYLIKHLSNIKVELQTRDEKRSFLIASSSDNYSVNRK